MAVCRVLFLSNKKMKIKFVKGENKNSENNLSNS